jgi:hypothetical protein
VAVVYSIQLDSAHILSLVAYSQSLFLNSHPFSPIMSETQNIAAWLPAVGAKLEVRPAPISEPGKDELLIQVSDLKDM